MTLTSNPSLSPVLPSSCTLSVTRPIARIHRPVDDGSMESHGSHFSERCETHGLHCTLRYCPGSVKVNGFPLIAAASLPGKGLGCEDHGKRWNH